MGAVLVVVCVNLVLVYIETGIRGKPVVEIDERSM